MKVPLDRIACASVIVVDDDPGTCAMLCLYLEAQGHQCVTATTGAEAVALCRDRHFDCMLLDARLGAMSGLSVAQRLGGQSSAMRPTHIFLLTGHPKSEFTPALRDGLVDGYILKSDNLEELSLVVRESVRVPDPT